MSPEERNYNHALAAVEKSIDDIDVCPERLKRAFGDELARLREMRRKLTEGRVDIALFAKVSCGKTALIRSLSGRRVGEVSALAGTTRRVEDWSWDSCAYSIPGLDRSEVRLIDTPGILEVNGRERARMAEEAARRADLALLLIDADLTDAEYLAFRQLAEARRPMVLVFNKADNYSRADRELIRKQALRRLGDLIGPDDVVEVEAAPALREYVIVRPDGTEVSEMRQPPPRIDALRERILAILERDGKALLALNAALFTAGASDRIAAMKIRFRAEEAEALILQYAALKGVAVALNPIPLVDIMGGVAIDVAMVIHLAQLYGLEMNEKSALGLVTTIAGAAGGLIAAEWTTHVAAGLVKVTIPLLGFALTAVPQGVVAAFSSYVVGHCAKYYLELGAAWGELGAKRVVENLMLSIDRESVLERLKAAILAQLAKRPTVPA